MGGQLSKQDSLQMEEPLPVKTVPMKDAVQEKPGPVNNKGGNCSFCLKSKKTEVAPDFCLDCRRRLCSTCLIKHGELAAMNGHHILNLPVNNNHGPGSQGGPQLPGETCREHETVLDAYCVNHRLVICKTCLDLYHKGCEEVKHILKIDKSFTKVQSDTKRLLEDLLCAKRSREDLMRQVDITESEDMEALQAYRKKIEKRLNEILESMRDEVRERRKRERGDIKNEIEEVEKSFEVTESDYKKLCELKNENESELVGCIQSLTQNAENAVELMANMGKNRPTPLAKYDLLDDIHHKSGFIFHGTFTFSDKLKREYNIEGCKDGNLNIINFGAIIQYSSKIVIITDYTNNHIKCLNLCDGKHVVFSADGGPWGICITGENEFAVTLADNRQVAFYTVQELLTNKKAVESDRRPWFSTEGICWNLGYLDNKLYISFEEGSQETEYCGWVGVYKLSGELLRKIDTDPLGKRIFSRAWEIKAHEGFIYVADEEKGIIKMDKHGNEISCITDKDLRKPKAFVFLNNGDMLVAGHDSENVIHFDKTGRRVAVLLSRFKDSLAQPSTIMFNSADSTLLVGSYESAIIQVFDLKGLLGH